MKTSSSVFRTVILLVSLLAATPLLAATNTWTGGGANDNLSTPGNWAGGTPGPLNATMFDDTDSGIASSGPFGTPNNIVDSTVTVQSVKYGNTNGFHTTQIPSGSILTVGGPATQLFYVGTGVDNGGVQTVYGTVLGQGSLLVNNAGGSIVIVQGSATTGAKLAAVISQNP